MAKECEKLAIGVILSGTGSDGTLGLKAVKEYGGVTMAQDPDQAEYGGMPSSAINSDIVDFVLPIQDLAQKVLDHKQVLGEVQVPLQEDQLPQEEATALQKIFGLLASKKEHDFKHYKRSSVLRRLQRRMFVTKNKSISEYHSYLESNADEIDELFKDLLISVTNFFRDPEAFEVLEKEVIPKLFEQKEPEDPIRVWVPGCATGEEVYSIGILLHEYAATLDYIPIIKIFGTDVSEEALRIARKGVYPESIATDLTDARLKRYFHKENSGYRIAKEIREKVLISHHDILSDPPFVNQDLISCRNLLIYFNPDLQNQVLNIIHYALNPEGFLFLGMADSTIGAKHLFESIENGNKIYRARQVPASEKEVPNFPLLPNIKQSHTFGIDKLSTGRDFTFDKTHYTLLARQYAPPSIIIDDSNRIMHSSRGVDKYLRYTEGEPTRDLLKIVSPELQRGLRTLIFQFNQLEEPATVSKEIEIGGDDKAIGLKLSLRPIKEIGVPKGYRQVTFEEIDRSKVESLHKKSAENRDGVEPDMVEQLEAELEQTKERLQQTIEQYETSNEELMASNEELQSMNEELQTTTEELETSKEELQSVNEELRTVNQELENKIDELREVNDDLKNLMEATEIGIIFVDKELNVQLFTENARNLFHLIESDKGRPLADVTHELQYSNIIADIEKMLNGFSSLEQQVMTQDGDWYIMQIKPYKTTEQDIEGAILTFVNITELKKVEKELAYRAKNEESLTDLGRYLLEAQKIQPVADRTLKTLTDGLGIKYGVVWELDEEKGQLLSKVAKGLSRMKNTVRELGNNSEYDYILKSDGLVIVDDFSSEDRFEIPEWIEEQDIVSGIYATMNGSQNKHGMIALYSDEPRSFTDHEINFMRNTANMLGEAIERIYAGERLKEINKELQEKIEIQKELQKDVLRVEKKERWSIGQFLHDELSQNLLAAKTLLDSKDTQLEQLDEETLEELENIKNLIIDSLGKIRELSHFVLPLNEEDVGTARDALELLSKQTENVYEVKCTVSADEITSQIDDQALSSTLYYIAQEAVSNAIKHGEADIIEMDLSANEESLYLIIRDNGTGYNSNEAEIGEGINIMKYRAELLDGSLEIEPSSDGSGTVVRCNIPMTKVNGE